MTKKIVTGIITCLINTNIMLGGNFSITRRIITRPKTWSQQEFFMYGQLDRGDVTVLSPSIAYGLTQTTGFQISLPIVVHEKHDNKHWKGLENMSFVGQWQWYQQPSNMGVVIAGVELPTRTFKRTPGESNAPISYINELLFIHSSEHWFAQADIELFTTPAHDHVQRFYAFSVFMGGGPKLTCNRGTLFTLLAVRSLETTHNASLFFFGPVFAYVHDNLTIGASVEWPIAQHVGPDAHRIDWILAFLIQVDF